MKRSEVNRAANELLDELGMDTAANKKVLTAALRILKQQEREEQEGTVDQLSLDFDADETVDEDE